MTQSDCDPGSSVLGDQSLNEEIDFCWIEDHKNSQLLLANPQPFKVALCKHDCRSPSSACLVKASFVNMAIGLQAVYKPWAISIQQKVKAILLRLYNAYYPPAYICNYICECHCIQTTYRLKDFPAQGKRQRRRC